MQYGEYKIYLPTPSWRVFLLEHRPIINLQTLSDNAAEYLLYFFYIATTATLSPLSPGVSAAVILKTVKVNDSDTTPGRAPVILKDIHSSTISYYRYYITALSSSALYSGYLSPLNGSTCTAEKEPEIILFQHQPLNPLKLYIHYTQGAV